MERPNKAPPPAGTDGLRALHEAQQALRESALRFRAAIDATADGIHIVDVETMRFIDVNETACRYLGYTRDEFLALGIRDIAPGADLARLSALYRQLFDGADCEQSAEIVHRHRDGTSIPIEIRRRGVVIGGRRLAVNVVRDITANKRIEATLRHHALQQSLIAGFGQQALASVDLDRLIARAAAVVVEGLDAAFCRVLQIAPDGVTLVVKAGTGWAPGWVGLRLDDGERLVQQVMALTAPVVADAAIAVARLIAPAMLAEHAVASGIEVPIVGSSGTYGVLGAYACAERGFAAENGDFLQSLANTLAAAVDRARAEQRLAYLAQFDTLTGLPNRSLFLDRLAQTLTQAQRNDWRLGVLFIDLDRFKQVNDTLGHEVGDRLLVQAAQRLQDCVRSGDTAGRLSGDEFAAVLSNLARPDDAAIVAQKVVGALSQPFELAGQEVRVSASVGIAIYPADGLEPDLLLKNADTAMYRAKARGRNSYQFYLPQMNERAVERLQLEGQLRGALARAEFELCYQPQCAAGGAPSGLAAMLRWQHPLHGPMPPQDFLGILEDTGLIVSVGEWALRGVCRQIAGWAAGGLAVPPVALRLSARQFHQPGLDTLVVRVLADTGADPGCLELEFTDAMLMHDCDEAMGTLRAIKALGVRLSVADFGTGCTSLTWLKRFPLDVLKIDAALVRGIDADDGAEAVVRAVIGLGRSLQLGVVATGVDSDAQRAFLREHGCGEMQDGPPLDAGACGRWLAAGGQHAGVLR